eukprot:gene14905-biopygen20146
MPSSCVTAENSLNIRPRALKVPVLQVQQGETAADADRTRAVSFLPRVAHQRTPPSHRRLRAPHGTRMHRTWVRWPPTEWDPATATAGKVQRVMKMGLQFPCATRSERKLPDPLGGLWSAVSDFPRRCTALCFVTTEQSVWLGSPPLPAGCSESSANAGCTRPS